ncbi:MAG: hypothetical protein AAGC45_05800 [Bacteroidota bacterium]
MEKRKIENSISDYLDGKLSQAENLTFEKHLQDNDSFRREVEEFKLLFKAMETEKRETPSKQLAKNFEKMLQEERSNQVKVVSLVSKNTRRFQFLKIAAGIALLIGVFLVGRYSGQKEMNHSLVEAQQEALEYKEATLISLLGNESASKRIQGVQLVEEFDQPDEDIVAALGEKLLGDENTNVRLSAMEALSKFSYSNQVKAVFIQALETEENPSIQVALIEILGQLQEKKAIGPMKKLLEKEGTQPFIKNEINNTIPKII